MAKAPSQSQKNISNRAAMRAALYRDPEAEGGLSEEFAYAKAWQKQVMASAAAANLSAKTKAQKDDEGFQWEDIGDTTGDIVGKGFGGLENALAYLNKWGTSLLKEAWVDPITYLGTLAGGGELTKEYLGANAPEDGLFDSVKKIGSDFVEQGTRDHYSGDTMFKEAGWDAPWYLDFAAEMVADPLNYVTIGLPGRLGSAGTKGLAKLMTSEKVIAKIARATAAEQGMGHIAASLSDDILRNTDVYKVVQKTAETDATNVLRKGVHALNRTQTEKYFGQKMGTRFMGAQFISPEITAVVTRPLSEAMHAVRRAPGLSRALDAFGGRFGLTLGKSLRSGDEDLAMRALRASRTITEETSKSAKIGNDLIGTFSRSIRGLSTKSLARVREAAQGGAVGVLTAKEAHALRVLREVTDAMHSTLEAAGEDVSYLGGYVPLFRWHDAQKMVGAIGGEAGSPALFARLKAGDTWLGHVIPEYANQAQREAVLTAIARKVSGNAKLELFDTNLARTIPRAIREAAETARDANIMRGLKENGLVVPSKVSRPAAAATAKARDLVTKITGLRRTVNIANGLADEINEFARLTKERLGKKTEATADAVDDMPVGASEAEKHSATVAASEAQAEEVLDALGVNVPSPSSGPQGSETLGEFTNRRLREGYAANGNKSLPKKAQEEIRKQAEKDFSTPQPIDLDAPIDIETKDRGVEHRARRRREEEHALGRELTREEAAAVNKSANTELAEAKAAKAAEKEAEKAAEKAAEPPLTQRETAYNDLLAKEKEAEKAITSGRRLSSKQYARINKKVTEAIELQFPPTAEEIKIGKRTEDLFNTWMDDFSEAASPPGKQMRKVLLERAQVQAESEMYSEVALRQSLDNVTSANGGELTDEQIDAVTDLFYGEAPSIDDDVATLRAEISDVHAQVALATTANKKKALNARLDEANKKYAEISSTTRATPKESFRTSVSGQIGPPVEKVDPAFSEAVTAAEKALTETPPLSQEFKDKARKRLAAAKTEKEWETAQNALPPVVVAEDALVEATTKLRNAEAEVAARASKINRSSRARKDGDDFRYELSQFLEKESQSLYSFLEDAAKKKNWGKRGLDGTPLTHEEIAKAIDDYDKWQALAWRKGTRKARLEPIEQRPFFGKGMTADDVVEQNWTVSKEAYKDASRILRAAGYDQGGNPFGLTDELGSVFDPPPPSFFSPPKINSSPARQQAVFDAAVDQAIADLGFGVNSPEAIHMRMLILQPELDRAAANFAAASGASIVPSSNGTIVLNIADSENAGNKIVGALFPRAVEKFDLVKESTKKYHLIRQGKMGRSDTPINAAASLGVQLRALADDSTDAMAQVNDAIEHLEVLKGRNFASPTNKLLNVEIEEAEAALDFAIRRVEELKLRAPGLRAEYDNAMSTIVAQEATAALEAASVTRAKVAAARKAEAAAAKGTNKNLRAQTKTQLADATKAHNEALAGMDDYHAHEGAVLKQIEETIASITRSKARPEESGMHLGDLTEVERTLGLLSKQTQGYEPPPHLREKPLSSLTGEDVGDEPGALFEAEEAFLTKAGTLGQISHPDFSPSSFENEAYANLNRLLERIKARTGVELTIETNSPTIAIAKAQAVKEAKAKETVLAIAEAEGRKATPTELRDAEVGAALSENEIREAAESANMRVLVPRDLVFTPTEMTQGVHYESGRYLLAKKQHDKLVDSLSRYQPPPWWDALMRRDEQRRVEHLQWIEDNRELAERQWANGVSLFHTEEATDAIILAREHFTKALDTYWKMYEKIETGIAVQKVFPTPSAEEAIKRQLSKVATLAKKLNDVGEGWSPWARQSQSDLAAFSDTYLKGLDPTAREAAKAAHIAHVEAWTEMHRLRTIMGQEAPLPTGLGKQGVKMAESRLKTALGNREVDRAHTEFFENLGPQSRETVRGRLEEATSKEYFRYAPPTAIERGKGPQAVTNAWTETYRAQWELLQSSKGKTTGEFLANIGDALQRATSKINRRYNPEGGAHLPTNVIRLKKAALWDQVSREASVLDDQAIYVLRLKHMHAVLTERKRSEAFAALTAEAKGVIVIKTTDRQLAKKAKELGTTAEALEGRIKDAIVSDVKAQVKQAALPPELLDALEVIAKEQAVLTPEEMDTLAIGGRGLDSEEDLVWKANAAAEERNIRMLMNSDRPPSQEWRHPFKQKTTSYTYKAVTQREFHNISFTGGIDPAEHAGTEAFGKLTDANAQRPELVSFFSGTEKIARHGTDKSVVIIRIDSGVDTVDIALERGGKQGLGFWTGDRVSASQMRRLDANGDWIPIERVGADGDWLPPERKFDPTIHEGPIAGAKGALAAAKEVGQTGGEFIGVGPQRYRKITGTTHTVDLEPWRRAMGGNHPIEDQILGDIHDSGARAVHELLNAKRAERLAANTPIERQVDELAEALGLAEPARAPTPEDFWSKETFTSPAPIATVRQQTPTDTRVTAGLAQWREHLLSKTNREAILDDPMSVPHEAVVQAVVTEHALGDGIRLLEELYGPNWRELVPNADELVGRIGQPMHSPPINPEGLNGFDDPVFEVLNVNDPAIKKILKDRMKTARAYVRALQDGDNEAALLYRASLEAKEPSLAVATFLEGAAKKRRTAAIGTEEEINKLWVDMPTSVSDLEEQVIIDNIGHGMQQLLQDPDFATTDDMVDVLSVMTDVLTPGAFSRFLSKYFDPIVTWNKSWLLTSPGTQVRNLWGGMFNNWLGSVSFSSYSLYVRLHNVANEVAGGPLWKALPTDEQEIVLLMRTHATSTGIYNPDFVFDADISTKVGKVREASRRTAKYNPLSAHGPISTPLRKMGHQADTFTRGAMFVDVLKNGGSVDEALDMVTRFHFDYADLSPLERKIKRVVPFYTWTRHNLPLQIEMLIHQPWKMHLWMKAKASIEEQSSEDGIVPDYFSEGMNLPIRTPFNVGGGHLYLQDVSPAADLAFLSDPISKGLGMVSPIARVPIEMALNRRSYKGYGFAKTPIVAPKLWTQVPFLMEAAERVGRAKKVDGQWIMSDKDAYAMENFLPMLARARRLHPSEPAYQRRQTSAFISFLFGGFVRTNTAEEQQALLVSKELGELYDSLEDDKVTEKIVDGKVVTTTKGGNNRETYKRIRQVQDGKLTTRGGQINMQKIKQATDEAIRRDMARAVSAR